MASTVKGGSVEFVAYYEHGVSRNTTIPIDATVDLSFEGVDAPNYIIVNQKFHKEKMNALLISQSDSNAESSIKVPVECADSLSLSLRLPQIQGSIRVRVETEPEKFEAGTIYALTVISEYGRLFARISKKDQATVNASDYDSDPDFGGLTDMVGIESPRSQSVMSLDKVRELNDQELQDYLDIARRYMMDDERAYGQLLLSILQVMRERGMEWTDSWDF